MNNATRLHYLEAMGIKSWQFRQPLSLANSPALASMSVIEPITTVPHTLLPIEIPTIAPVVLPLDNWETLQNEVINCQKCSLCETRTHTVFGTGKQNPDWLLIGEAPGEQEDWQGQPFVGTAGLLLTEMLRAIGLNREHIFIANILKCRPPNNRNPQIHEIAACQPFLERQIAFLKPKIIVAVGRIAAQQLLNTHETLKNLRGNVYDIKGIPMIAIYHPAYLLRSLSQKQKAWQDLQLALKTYQNITKRSQNV